MYPILFKVFGFPVHSYGVMLLIAFFVGVMLAKKRAPRFGLEPQDVYDAAFWALILGVIGARVVFIAQEWPYYSTHPKELYSWQFEGLTSFGAIIFGFFGFYIWARKKHKSFVRILDCMAAPFLIAHAIGRVGCLLNGCCYGGVCDLPWAIHVNGINDHLFHPAQIYDSLMNIAAFGILIYIEKKRGIPYGRSVSLMLILHGTCRYIYEFWREGTDLQVKEGLATSTYMKGLPFNITDAQVAALFIVLIGVVSYFVLPLLQNWRSRRVPALEA
jgi:phosphatidylglycerol---prolipoprotein diacylglyceryl transferase